MTIPCTFENNVRSAIVRYGILQYQVRMVDSVILTIYIFTDFFHLVVLSIVERGVYDSCISKLCYQT